MTDLFWPGDELAGDLMSDAAFLAAMVAVEQAWLDGLVAAGIAPQEARAELAGLVADGDAESIAAPRRCRRQPGQRAGRADAGALRARRRRAGCTAG